MKKEVIKPPKVALCRECHGTGHIPVPLLSGRGRRVLCEQCGGSGRVTVSAKIEMDIRPYNPRKVEE